MNDSDYDYYKKAKMKVWIFEQRLQTSGYLSIVDLKHLCTGRHEVALFESNNPDYLVRYQSELRAY